MGIGDVLLNSVSSVKNAGVTMEWDVLGHGQVYPQLNFVLMTQGREVHWYKEKQSSP